MVAALARAGSGSSCFVAAAVAQHALLPAAARGAVVPELTKLGVDAPASINIVCEHRLKQCDVSWQLKQSPWLSRRATARAVGERRLLHRGGSSVENV